MSRSTQEVIDDAMKLPPEERAKLAEQLLDSLDPDEQKAVDEAWVEEIQRRIAAVEAGEMRLIPGDEVLRELRERKS